MIPTPNNLYLCFFFSHKTNKKWRNCVPHDAKEKRRKKEIRKLKKEQKINPHGRNIESKYMYTNLIFLSYFFHDSKLLSLIFYFASNKKFGRNRDRDRSMK